MDIYENLLKNDSVLEVENFFSARYQHSGEYIWKALEVSMQWKRINQNQQFTLLNVHFHIKWNNLSHYPDFLKN